MSRDILPEPPEELKRLSAALSGRLRERIRSAGPLPFSDYMEAALYQPGLGYYSAGLHKLGAEGDFVTAPELGGLFASCLARQAAEIGRELGEFDILEVGAGSGRLAAGLLGGLGEGPAPRRYRILERSADLRRVQRDTLAREAPDWLERCEWLEAPPDRSWQGLLLANEVIDALPVERFEREENAIRQLCVADGTNGLEWSSKLAPEALENEVRRLESELGQPFPVGYRSELCLMLAPWLEGLAATLDRGLALFIDYGYPRAEYYRPDRHDGTLMCHYRHRAHDDPFFWPGLQDLTAWVDFTRLAEAGEAAGLDVLGYASQAMFLLGCGLDEVLAERMAEAKDGGLALGAEARQLTLPSLMGERFAAMGLGRGLDFLPLGFSLQDLRYRL